MWVKKTMSILTNIKAAFQKKKDIIVSEDRDERLINILMDEYNMLVYSDDQLEIVNILLHNQLCHLNETYPNCSNEIKQLLMNVASKVIRQLLLFDRILGLQPMTSPIGLVEHLTYRQTRDNDTPNEPALISLHNASKVIQAYSYKLRTKLTSEALSELHSYYGMDLNEELAEVLSQAISIEISSIILCDLIKLTEQNSRSLSATMESRASVVSLGLHQNSMDIARKTRRGMGNKIITTPEGVALLQSIDSFNFVPASEGKDNGSVNCIEFVGYVTNRKYEVYSTVLPALAGNTPDEIKFLTMYNGRFNRDTGYIFSPYVPVVCVKNFQSNDKDPVTLCTRYGKWIKGHQLEPMSESELGTAEDYCSLLTVKVDFDFPHTEKPQENS